VRAAGLQWQIEQVGSGARGSISLALDALGQPHVAYDQQSAVHYVYRGPSGWADGGTVHAGDTRACPALCLNAAGQPHVVYTYKAGGGGPDPYYIRHAARDAGVWATTDLWRDETDAKALVADPGGGLALAFHDEPTDTVQYATWPGSGTWSRQTIDGGGDVLALAFDGAGQALIGYRDQADRELMLRRMQPGAKATKVDDGYYVPPSLGVGANAAGDVFLAYGVQLDAILRSAIADGQTWSYSTIDATDWARAVSMAMDSQGLPHVAYRFENQVRYAAYDGSAWRTSVVASVPVIGEVSLGLDGLDRPWVAYVHNVDGTDIRPMLAHGVPEPGMLCVMTAGGLALTLRRRRAWGTAGEGIAPGGGAACVDQRFARSTRRAASASSTT
jgi:hypothetical protein